VITDELQRLHDQHVGRDVLERQARRSEWAGEVGGIDGMRN
jgi:hypothetical protein